MTAPITIAYTPHYLAWEGSHASPERAHLAVEHIKSKAKVEGAEITLIEPELDTERAKAELALVHDSKYVQRIFKGADSHAPNRLQGRTATYMFMGTVALIDRMTEDGLEPRVYFNPQGAKHHAGYDHSSGFCVFNDHAWAAQYLAAQGYRVAYLDWDAHHGDGVEDLTRDNENILTASIHQHGIFPGTGWKNNHAKHVYNYALFDGDGDTELLEAVEDALHVIDEFVPDVLLLATGADGLKQDPLAGLTYTIEGLTKAAHLVGTYARHQSIPVVIGGAGGYTPLTYTPVVWSEVVHAVHYELSQPEPVEIDDTGVAEIIEDIYPEETHSEEDADERTAILARLTGSPLAWEGQLSTREYGIVQSIIEPQIMAAHLAEQEAEQRSPQKKKKKRRKS